jgi:two-component system response regulator GlrR
MPGKLLCVTQNPQRKQGLFHCLESGGYDIDVATDRQQAVSLSERKTYDVALVDQLVDDDDGVEIFRDIDRRQHHVGGVLCCEQPTIAQIDSAIAAGVKHVVVSPEQMGNLTTLIDGDIRESSRSFDERFPNAVYGFATEEGVVKGESACCESCSRITNWHHKRLGRSFCCADCLARYLSLHGG